MGIKHGRILLFSLTQHRLRVRNSNKSEVRRKQPIFIFNLRGGEKMVTRFLLANLTRDKENKRKNHTRKHVWVFDPQLQVE